MAVIDRFFVRLELISIAMLCATENLFLKEKYLLGSPTGYSLEKEMSEKLTEGCRLRRAKLSKAVRLRGKNAKLCAELRGGKAGSFSEGAVSVAD